MKSNQDTIADKKMSLVEHLTDLRKYILKAIVALVLGIGLVLFFVKDIYYYLTEPLGVTRLIYITPTEGFLTFLKIILYGGFVVGSPVIIFQLLKFVLPGLYKHEKIVLFVLIPISFILMVGGMSFGYFVLLPHALSYLLDFGTFNIQAVNIQPMLSMQKYIGFVITTLTVLGITFQLPLVIIGLTKLGLITPRFLRKSRKFAVVVAVVLGAILTPPDIITQLIMAGPLLLLYEASIWLSYLFWRKKQEKKKNV